MSRITQVSLANRVTVFFLFVATVLAGISAYISLPRESFPDIEIPLVIVYTVYPGAAPADVESQVTDPLERELKGLAGLKKLTSTSSESASVITVEYVSGTDIDTALQKVRDRVDLAKPDLPKDAEDPVLQEINFSDIPIIQVHLSGDVGPVVLKQIAEDLQEEIEALRGVLKVDLVGGLEREVRVDVDPKKLHVYGLALKDVVDAIRDENVSIPGGEIDLGDRSFAVRVPGEVDDPMEVADFVIEARDGRPIFVRDVADVSFGFKDRTSFARIDRRESVALFVQKRTGANIIEVADRVKQTVDEEGEAWPGGVEASVLGDLSKDIRKMVLDLENNVLTGLVLVIAVLMFALNFRNAVFVGIAIPLSMLIAFIALQISGTTLNMVVLFSLILAVGMLVDNAIVVIENIYRHVQEGSPRLQAAEEATREVGAAIFVSTLTTLAAFSPLLFWPGIIGDFMYYLPLTVCMTLIASLLIAFTLNPVLAGTFMRQQSKDRDGSENEGWKIRVGESIITSYRASLKAALEHRIWVLVGTAAIFVGVLVIYGRFHHGIEFFPSTEPPQILVDVELPAGTRVERTDEIVQELESRLAGLPDLRVLAAGSGAGSQSEFGGSSGGGGTKGRITLDLVDRKVRSQSSFLTMDEAREVTGALPGVVVDVDRPDEGPPVGDPVSIELRGDDFVTLGEISRSIRDEIQDIPGLVSLDDDFDLARPEIVFHVDRTQAALLGLSTTDISSTLRTAVNGTEASVFRDGNEDVDITVRLRESSRRSVDDLARLTVVTEDGAQIPLSSVARIERSNALTSINHKDRKRVVTVSGRVTSPRLADPVRREAQSRIEAMHDVLPSGYSMSFSGQSEDEEEAKEFLTKAFTYGVLMVLGLMVAKFDSVAIPLIIITSVIMSLVGVLIGLLVTGLPFGIIMSGLGVISLAGIVVNNAIVLLDYGEQLWKKGDLARRELVMITGARRLRPVLLTAITTILGLIPLATGFEFDFHEFAFSTGGESSQWWRSMAVSVIFGLAFATFLTLIVVPILYDFLLQWRERGQRGSSVDGDLEDGEEEIITQIVEEKELSVSTA